MSERTQQLRLVEALLFAAGEPLTEEMLGRRLDDKADLRGLLGELAEHYAGRGVNLVRLAGGWAFRTAPDLAGALRIERPVARRLSRAAVETLAVIAYHQPVTRAEIEEIRGVSLGKGIIDTLMEAGWVRPKGRRMSPGRPLLWVTTPSFLAHFGLDSLRDLPAIDELRAAGLLDLTPPTLGESAAETRQMCREKCANKCHSSAEESSRVPGSSAFQAEDSKAGRSSGAMEGWTGNDI